MRLVFDIETDGLLDTLTKVHCISTIDVDSGQETMFSGEDIQRGLRLLSMVPIAIGHNVIRFDIPALKKVYPDFHIGAQIIDTLVSTSVLWPERTDADFALLRSGHLPPEFQREGLIGKHSLRAWGYRLGERKGDFKGPWDKLTEEMLAYCMQDTRVTVKLYKKILHELESYPNKDFFALEHQIAPILHEQTARGFPVHWEKLQTLTGKLAARRAELQAECATLFPPWKKSLGMFTPKVNNKKQGYIKGVPIERFKEMVFNPGSRQHIADRLTTIHGWKPEKFTDGGSPQVDEKVLGSLPYPEAKLLSEYLEIQKHLGMVAEGDNGWIKLARKGADGVYRLHGEVHQNGTVTGRASHSKPNLAQVPKGDEFREIFTAGPGLVMVGTDLEGIELRCLAHYVNDAEFTKAIVDGKSKLGTDAHTRNRDAVGYPPTKEGRDHAKTLLYAFMYGAADPKLGTISATALGLTGLGERKTKALGTDARAKLMRGITGLEDLIDRVKTTAKKRGYLRGLDGRRLNIRGEHSALNTLLQSAGAVIAKRWMVLSNASTCGLAAQVAWVHDELQLQTLEENAIEVGEKVVAAAAEAGRYYEFRCPVGAAYSVAKDWAGSH